MSRDWKPFEQVIYDENAHLTRGEYIHDGKFTMHMKKEDDGVQLWNDDARKEFPNLSFLLEKFELVTYPEIKNDEYGVIYDTYKGIEIEIGFLADTLRKQIQNNERLNLDNAHVPNEVYDWFMGELDTCFYYREENNSLFREYIEDRILENMKERLADAISELNSLKPIQENTARCVFLNRLCPYLNTEIHLRESALEKDDLGEER